MITQHTINVVIHTRIQKLVYYIVMHIKNLNKRNLFMSRKFFTQSFLVVACLFGAGALSAWTPAPASPPSNNVSAPINTSATNQVKSGGLSLGSLFVDGGMEAKQIIAGSLGITLGGVTKTSWPDDISLNNHNVISKNIDCGEPYTTCIDCNGGGIAISGGISSPNTIYGSYPHESGGKSIGWCGVRSSSSCGAVAYAVCVYPCVQPTSCTSQVNNCGKAGVYTCSSGGGGSCAIASNTLCGGPTITTTPAGNLRASAFNGEATLSWVATGENQTATSNVRCRWTTQTSYSVPGNQESGPYFNLLATGSATISELQSGDTVKLTCRVNGTPDHGPETTKTVNVERPVLII